jgi:hypothetical protein
MTALIHDLYPIDSVVGHPAPMVTHEGRPL